MTLGRRYLIAPAVIAVVLALGRSPFAEGQTPPRDTGARPGLTGNSSISGQIVSDEAGSRPVRNVLVRINHIERGYSDAVVTDVDGRFTFVGVPAGRYSLAAEKKGFLPIRYGQTRHGRSGTPIALAEGQHMSDLLMRLTKGGVLSGTIIGPSGEPASGIMLALKRATVVNGERKLTEAYSSGESTTDDRGTFRIYGLPPGDYVIQAVPQHSYMSSSEAVHVTSAADVQWARALLSFNRPGDRTPDPALPPSRERVILANIYFPGTLQQSNATVVTLGPGEERTGLDFALQLLPSQRVSGTITMPDGSTPKLPPQVALVELGPTSAWYSLRRQEGTQFSFDGVTQGSYALGAVVNDTRMWALQNIVVAGQDQSLTITLQPGMTASGQLTFSGTGSAAQPSPVGVMVGLEAIGAPGELVLEASSVPAAVDGTFKVAGITPGTYRLTASWPGQSDRPRTGDWTLQSAALGGRDIAFTPIVIRPGMALDDVIVTFTNRPTEVSGRLQDATGRAATDYYIVVFSADERGWFRRSPRVQSTRPANDGSFVVRGLPPGDYFVAALTDLESDELYDAAFLRQIMPAAQRIALADGEKKIHNLQIAK